MTTGTIYGLGMSGGLITGKDAEGDPIAAHRIGRAMSGGFTKADKTLSLGMEDTQDYMVSQPWLNICRTGRYLIFGNNVTISHEDFIASGRCDSEGYLQTRDPAWNGNLMILWAYRSDNFTPLFGDHTFTCDGTDEPSLGGATLISKIQTATGWEVKFNVSAAGNFWIYWETFTTAGRATNMVCVQDAQRPAYDSGEIYRTDYINSLEHTRHIRFMNGMKTNDLGMANWADYPDENSFTYGLNIPIKAAVDLCNRVGADMWLCVPSASAWAGGDGVVDTSFAVSLATYVKANLHPDLKFYCEYSNEVWNFAFAVHNQMETQAIAAGWTSSSTSRAGYCAKINVLMSRDMAAVYGDEANDRFVWVTASGVAQGFWSNELADAAKWQLEEPENWEHPTTYTKTFAVATYDGTSYITDGTERNALLAHLTQDPAPTEQETNTYVQGRVDALGYVAEANGHVLLSHTAFTAEGFTDMLGYEGGRHILHSFATGLTEAEVATVQDALIAYTFSAESGAVEAAKWDYWKTLAKGPYMIFTDYNDPSRFGAFCLYERLGQTNPRATYITNRSNTETPWWFDDRYPDLSLL